MLPLCYVLSIFRFKGFVETKARPPSDRHGAVRLQRVRPQVQHPQGLSEAPGQIPAVGCSGVFQLSNEELFAINIFEIDSMAGLFRRESYYSCGEKKMVLPQI